MNLTWKIGLWTCISTYSLKPFSKGGGAWADPSLYGFKVELLKNHEIDPSEIPLLRSALHPNTTLFDQMMSPICVLSQRYIYKSTIRHLPANYRSPKYVIGTDIVHTLVMKERPLHGFWFYFFWTLLWQFIVVQIVRVNTKVLAWNSILHFNQLFLNEDFCFMMKKFPCRRYRSKEFGSVQG